MMHDDDSNPLDHWPRVFFDAAAESPGYWLLRAFELKVGAQRLDWIAKPVTAEEGALSLIGPYRLLMALSFENLLKGSLIAQGLPLFVGVKFNKKLDSHDLWKLAVEVDSVVFQFTPDELEILKEQTMFISWAGRYPLPKKAEKYLPAGHSNYEMSSENTLWNRLFHYLYGVAWIMKGGTDNSGGHRFYLDKTRREGR